MEHTQNNGIFTSLSLLWWVVVSAIFSISMEMIHKKFIFKKEFVSVFFFNEGCADKGENSPTKCISLALRSYLCVCIRFNFSHMSTCVYFHLCSTTTGLTTLLIWLSFCKNKKENVSHSWHLTSFSFSICIWYIFKIQNNHFQNIEQRISFFFVHRLSKSLRI